MLSILSIKNIILIDKLEIDFKGGLCVITGETGAGKSIILNSLNLAIGQRANYNLRPNNDEITEVVASFIKTNNAKLEKKFNDLGLEFSEEIILKRQLLKDGKSRSFINENLVSLSTLKKIGSELILIESQFSEQGLLDSNSHINILDEFGEYDALLNEVEKNWLTWEKNKNDLKTIKDNCQKRINEKENIEYSLSELNKLDPKVGEYEELIDLKKNIVNYTKINESLSLIISNISSESKNGIEELISENIQSLEKIKQFLSVDLKNFIQTLDSMLIEIQEQKSLLLEFQEKSNLKNSSIDEIEERIFSYSRLIRKYSCEADELIDKKKELEFFLNQSDEDLKEIEKKEEETIISREVYSKTCNVLSQERKKYSEKMSHLINIELPELKLENTEFQSKISESTNPGIKGNNNVFFNVKTNKNTEFNEIKKVTSGGELSRFALAIKVVTSRNNITSIVFDEVDSGIGGAVASAVGERLRKLGQKRQVIVVTHSPQVAALGNEHYKVIKVNTNEENYTTIKKIESQHKVDEIARMLSGKEITDEAKLAAKKLIDNF